MHLHPTPLAGLTVIETERVGDERGQFERLYCETELRALDPAMRVAQANLSTTFEAGTVRGMHFQRPPAAEGKLVRCLRGRVYDVAVDVRSASPTFLHWHAVELDADAALQVFIPAGFAHGFQALTRDVQLLYLHSERWNRDLEATLRHDDPALAIRWPLPVGTVSRKDREAPLIDAGFEGVRP